MIFRTTFPVGTLACNCTLLSCPKTKLAVVIDPGAEGTKILSEIAKQGLTVTQILHTHTHIDHVGATAALADATAAPTRWHASDQFLIDNLSMQARFLGVDEPPLPRLTAPLFDGETLHLAEFQIEVLHVPGHSPGSVMFVLRTEKLCISGDMIFANGGLGRTDLPGGDAKALAKSLTSVVLTLPPDYILVPGHGPETTVGKERANHRHG